MAFYRSFPENRTHSEGDTRGRFVYNSGPSLEGWDRFLFVEYCSPNSFLWNPDERI